MNRLAAVCFTVAVATRTRAAIAFEPPAFVPKKVTAMAMTSTSEALNNIKELKIVGQRATVVDHNGLKVDELIGNVSTSQDALTLAHVHRLQPTSTESWVTIQYDEWFCCVQGSIELHQQSSSNDDTIASDSTTTVTTIQAGQTCFVPKGARFRPVLKGPAEYIAVTTPAFTPERVAHEPVTGGTTTNWSQLYREAVATATTATASSVAVVNNDRPDTADDDDTVYHMCPKLAWDEAVRLGNAYFPPTFEQDGGFTHATAIPERLLTTANHFYTKSTGEWVCLALSQAALRRIGIVTRFEAPMAVGSVPTNQKDGDGMECPHIYGGIPTLAAFGVVQSIRPMTRNSAAGEFLSIAGLTDKVA
jgi:uncharacterized protein (DUF952 family)/mannose-6-phosphate isomerase-like protein (cupin superfamily)